MGDDDKGWVYEPSADGSARFVLGTVGDNPLVCFGINPSIAVPNSLDPTVRRVRGLASTLEFDSWTMLNVYPQIATLPKDIGVAILGIGTRVWFFPNIRGDNIVTASDAGVRIGPRSTERGSLATPCPTRV